MPAHRKSIAELALTGTLSNHPGRYAARIESETATKTKRVTTGSLGRVPAHLSKEEKACWREIVNSAGVLGQSDRLMLEVASQLMAKQRRGKAKVAEMNRLVSILERFISPAESSSLPVSEIPKPKDKCEEFFEQCAKEDEQDRLIRAEMKRRRELGQHSDQTPEEFERWCWWMTVRDEFALS